MRYWMKHWAPISLSAAAAALLASCAPTQVKKSTPPPPAAATQAPEPAYTPGADVTEASLRGSEFSKVEGIEPIHFDYDSSALGQTALDTLKKNAEYLKSHGDLEILVSGHCDARGTVEYNLALGQKRARSVREYYMRLGVPGKAMATISYGKEKPACSEANEACYAKNRRAETLVRARVAAKDSPAKDPAAQ